MNRPTEEQSRFNYIKRCLGDIFDDLERIRSCGDVLNVYEKTNLKLAAEALRELQASVESR